MTGGIGKKITEEQIKLEKKYIDYKKLSFPISESFYINDSGKKIKLESYKYPTTLASELKRGTVFFVHGYGDYVGRYAYFAKQFAEQGYDFVGIDQRGFGRSDGRRGIIESEEQAISDQIKYVESVMNSKDYNRNGGNYLIGYSLGGLLASRIVAEQPKLFNAMGLLTPYIDLKSRELLDKFLPLAKMMNYVYPTYRLAAFPTKKEDQPKPHYVHFLDKKEDPLVEFHRIPVHNVVLNAQMMNSFLEKTQERVKTPLLMILGG